MACGDPMACGNTGLRQFCILGDAMPPGSPIPWSAVLPWFATNPTLRVCESLGTWGTAGGLAGALAGLFWFCCGASWGCLEASAKNDRKPIACQELPNPQPSKTFQNPPKPSQGSQGFLEGSPESLPICGGIRVMTGLWELPGPLEGPDRTWQEFDRHAKIGRGAASGALREGAHCSARSAGRRRRSRQGTWLRPSRRSRAVAAPRHRVPPADPARDRRLQTLLLLPSSLRSRTHGIYMWGLFSLRGQESPRWTPKVIARRAGQKRSCLDNPTTPLLPTPFPAPKR